jgi:hypothetical protein
MAVDRAGNVYVTGESYNGDVVKGGTDYDIVTIKYNTDGNVVWKQRYDGQEHGKDHPRKVAVDFHGNVYVFGSAGAGLADANGMRGEFVLLKYNAKGDRQWVTPYHGPVRGADLPANMTVDDKGFIYVTGGAVLSAKNHTLSFLTIKYDSEGDEVWRQSWSDGKGDDIPTDITLALVSGKIM